MSPAADGAQPSQAVVEMLVAVASRLAAQRDTLNRLDGVAGDGDLGVTVSLAADAIRDIASDLSGLPAPDVLRRVGSELAKRAPSTSGTLVAFAFLAAGRVGTVGGGTAGAVAIPYLEAATRSIGERGKVAVGDRTMLDALVPAFGAFREAVERGESVQAASRAAATAADEGAVRTATMTPTVGRASWLGDRAMGHEDAGARLVAMAFDAAAAYVDVRSASPEAARG